MLLLSLLFLVLRNKFKHALWLTVKAAARQRSAASTTTTPATATTLATAARWGDLQIVHLSITRSQKRTHILLYNTNTHIFSFDVVHAVNLSTYVKKNQHLLRSSTVDKFSWHARLTRRPTHLRASDTHVASDDEVRVCLATTTPASLVTTTRPACAICNLTSPPPPNPCPRSLSLVLSLAGRRR